MRRRYMSKAGFKTPEANNKMTTPHERTRSLLWAGSFLIELAQDPSLPLRVRRSAVVIARHFPTIEQVAQMALLERPSVLGSHLAAPDEVDWDEEWPMGPLRYSTRLERPSEP